ncbi:Gis4 protein [Maudiozyma humilis]|uniref:Gis4 protein n=1 Tax=Maudiozyma humilis TaxID=51915 RepID=A0AAV5RS91_MAUHU|nr:Gis4 protein [Kazachstania humilis]
MPMPKPVRVGDYYDNDDNGLWSWYLKNIRAGDFEELTQNELKFSLLRRFLYNKFIKEPEDSGDGATANAKILFISIPDNIHSDISLLEAFLKEYFHLEDLANINIIKLTHDKCYNHENHYVLIDRVNNFDDPTFLEYVKPQHYTKYTPGPVASPDGSVGFGLAAAGKHTPAESINADKTNTNTDTITHATTITDGGSKLIDTVRTVTGGTMDHTLTYTNSASVSQQRSIASSYSSGSSLSSSDSRSISSASISSASYSSSYAGGSSFSASGSGSRSDSRSQSQSQTQINQSNVAQSDSNIVTGNRDSQVTNNTQGSSAQSAQSAGTGTSASAMADTTSSMIEFNFPRTKLHSHPNSNTDAGIAAKQLMSGVNGSGVRQSGSGFYTPPQSEIVSINSFAETRSKILEIDTEPLHQTRSRSELSVSIVEDQESNDFPNQPYGPALEPFNDNFEQEEEEEEYGDSHSNMDSASFSSSMTMSTETTSTDSVYSILPSISIKSHQGHFRLVLQSMLTLNDDRQIYTAIRQSNNLIDDADVSDDWILYDQNFSMNNLIMLALKDLFEWGQNLKKILFYSMVFIDDNVALEPTAMTKQEDLTTGLQSGPENSDVEVPQLLFADDAEQDPKMHMAERIQTNNTIAHRSIRTINSIGEWAFKKKSSNTMDRGSEYYGSDSTDSDYYPQAFDGPKDQMTKQNTKQNTNDNVVVGMSPTSKGKKAKDMGDLKPVERWKSMPNKNVQPKSGESKKWKKKMKQFRKGKSQDDKDTFCTIM